MVKMTDAERKCLKAGLSVAVCTRTKGRTGRYKAIVLADRLNDIKYITEVEYE